MEMEQVATFEVTQPSITEQYAAARLLLRDALKATGRVYLSYRFDDHFFSLSENEKLSLLDGIRRWSHLMLEYVAHAGNSKNTKNLVRYYLSRLNVSVPTDFIDQIQDGDIVEIYGSDSKRLFFNPELFDYSSYAPDVMFSKQWWNLYERDVEISEKIQKMAYMTFMGLNKNPFRPDLPVHTVKEIRSQGRYESDVEIKAMSPVNAGDTIIGVAALERFTMLTAPIPSRTHS
jgi:hypothetical protein